MKQVSNKTILRIIGIFLNFSELFCREKKKKNVLMQPICPFKRNPKPPSSHESHIGKRVAIKFLTSSASKHLCGVTPDLFSEPSYMT